MYSHLDQKVSLFSFQVIDNFLNYRFFFFPGAFLNIFQETLFAPKRSQILKTYSDLEFKSWHIYFLFQTKEGWAPTTQDLDKHNCTTMKNTSITSSRVPMYDFILLQLVMLVMLLTFIVYPLPRRAYSYSEYIAVGVEFINAFDTMDMISDLEFVQNYGLAWEIVFYISLGVTAVHIAFPIKVENEDMVWAQNITITSQSSTMHTESSVDGITNTTMEGGSHYSLKSILDAPIVFETDFAVQTVYTDGNLQTRNISIDATDSLSGKKNRPPSTNAVSPKESKQHHEGNNDGNLKRISTKFKKTALERYAVHFSETQKKTIKVFLTVVCTDLFFALIRFKIMMEEHSAVHGFNMFVKNLILFCFHSSYLLQHVHSLIRTKLLQDIERERSA